MADNDLWRHAKYIKQPFSGLIKTIPDRFTLAFERLRWWGEDHHFFENFIPNVTHFITVVFSSSSQVAAPH